MVAAAQVIVYIGAISVLILFAIMLTQEKVGAVALDFQTQAAPAAVAAIVIAVLVALVAADGTDWGAVDAHRPDRDRATSRSSSSGTGTSSRSRPSACCCSRRSSAACSWPSASRGRAR